MRTLRAIAIAAAALMLQWASGAAVAPLGDEAAVVGAAGPLISPQWFAAAVAIVVLAWRQPAGVLAVSLLAWLPWLAPGVPAAWVFTGPAVAFLWLGAVLSVDRFGTAWPRHWRVWQSPWAATALGAIWLAACAHAVAPRAMSGDAPHYLTIAQSLVDDGDVELTNNYDQATYSAFYSGSLEPRHTNLSPWGEQYSFHGLGVAVLVTPAFAVAGVSGATATLVALLALGGTLTWLAARRLTGQIGAAWFAWACLLGVAPYTFHAAAIYPDGPAAVAVAGAFWLLARLADDRPVPLTTLALVGGGLATLPWLHVRLALPAAVCGVACAVEVLRRQPERWTRLSWLFFVPPMSAAAWVAASYVMFDTWNPMTAMLQRTAPGSLAVVPTGFFGVMADHEFGLLPTSPVFFLAPIGLVALATRHRVIAVAGTVAVASVAMMASLWGWWGGDSAPARLLVVVVPVLALALGVTWATSGVGLRRVLVAALAVSVTLTALMARLDGGAHAYSVPDGQRSVFQVLSPAVDLSAALPSLFRPGASLGSEWPVAVVWLAALALVSVALSWRPSGGVLGRGVAACAALLIGGAAAGTAWAVRGVTAFTPGASALALMQRLADDASGSLVTWPDRSPDDLARRIRLRTPESVPPPAGVLLHVPDVPAGSYEIAVDPSVNGTGAELSLELGRDAWTYATWRIGDPPPRLTLATALHSVRVVGPAGLVGNVRLVPTRAPFTSGAPMARRVTRLGGVDVYAVDDNTFAEPGIFWIGADRSARLLVASNTTAQLTGVVSAGPAAVTLDIDAAGRSTRLTLAPNARGDVALGSVGPGTPLLVRIVTSGGFPAQLLRDGDSRRLSAWMTVRAQP